MNNRYVQLAGLTLCLAALFYVLIWAIFYTIGVKDFPPLLHIGVVLLTAGYVVARYFARRIG